MAVLEIDNRPLAEFLGQPLFYIAHDQFRVVNHIAEEPVDRLFRQPLVGVFHKVMNARVFGGSFLEGAIVDCPDLRTAS